MNLVKISVLSLFLSTTAMAADDCSSPEIPSLPDGASSTMEQMIAGQSSVKAFQAANLEYMACVQTQIDTAERHSKEGDADEMLEGSKAYEVSVDAYNAAVSAEEELAGEFNAQIRAYKAANK